MKRVTIVVLGDVGRSPRMQYHASSLLSLGYYVTIIGYGGSKPIKELTNNEKLRLITISESPEFNLNFPRLLAFFLKIVWQIWTLAFGLKLSGSADFLLVQSPPAIPTLAICWFYCVLRQITFIIDWHNYAFSNMALTLGDNNLLVRISHWYEGFFGRKSHHNICVTKSMKTDLKTRWNIDAQVLYDKPFHSFSPITLEEKHSFFKRIGKTYNVFIKDDDDGDENSTAFTSLLPNGTVKLKKSRPAILVSSTSWTPDEDFNILLIALKVYDLTDRSDLPKLICVVTGKGQLKEYYKKKIDNYKWKKVKIVTPWLEPEDYPLMLASADLGVCLHKSSSGLDLPMKVVDMFGVGLPVAAFKFKALPELVKEGENGMTFSSEPELMECFYLWFLNFPYMKFNDEFRSNISRDFKHFKWHENWMNNVSYLFQYESTSQITECSNDCDKNK